MWSPAPKPQPDRLPAQGKSTSLQNGPVILYGLCSSDRFVPLNNQQSIVIQNISGHLHNIDLSTLDIHHQSIESPVFSFQILHGTARNRNGTTALLLNASSINTIIQIECRMRFLGNRAKFDHEFGVVAVTILEQPGYKIWIRLNHHVFRCLTVNRVSVMQATTPKQAPSSSTLSSERMNSRTRDRSLSS
jgi:hypothetical protein